MNILAEIQNLINEFNKTNKENLEIDSVRSKFNKRYKLQQLEKLGNWKKINKNDRTIMDKLKKRLDADEVTSAYQLENYNVYYYNSNKDAPRYRTAIMVIFGLKQYHKDPPPQHIVSKIISILKNISSIDICKDLPIKPNLQQLQQHFYLKRYFDKRIKAYTDTYYINETDVLMLDKICIYNKAFKNGLIGILFRMEGTFSIPNIKYLALPLYEFKQITNLAKVSND